MTHKQWLLHNAKIYIKCEGDLNAEEHDKLLTKIGKLIWIDPEDLLHGDKHLLKDEFGVLGKASALDQQLWVAEIKDSITAANHKRKADKDTGYDTKHDSKRASGAILTKPLDLTGERGSKGNGV